MKDYECSEGGVRFMRRASLLAIAMLCIAAITVMADPVDADDGDAEYREEGIIVIHLDTALAQHVKYGMRIYEGKVADYTPDSDLKKEIERVMVTGPGRTVRDFQTAPEHMGYLANMEAGYYAIELYDEEKKVDSRWIDMTVYGVKILDKELYVKEGGTGSVGYEVYYDRAYTLVWTSTDGTVAQVVSDSGSAATISGNSLGVVTITARIHDTATDTDTDYTGSSEVTVYKQATNILPDPTSEVLYYDDPTKNTVKINVEPVPNDALVKLVWTSDDESVATVTSDGVVTGLSRGMALITVTDTLSGISKVCRITVLNTPGPTPPGPTPPGPVPTDLIVEPEEITLKLEETFVLKAILVPAGSKWTLEWSSSDPTIVSVSEDGAITGHRVGTAIVTVKAGDLRASCLVHVVDTPGPVVTVTLEADDMEVGGYQMAKVTVRPSDSGIEPVSWSSSDESVATVDSIGMIHAVGEGEVTIKVTMSNGQTASVTIKVLPAPEPEPEHDHAGNWCTWFWIIILIVIIVELVLAFRYRRRYKQLEDEVNAS